MTTYAIERNGNIVLHVVFKGSGLYREKDVLPLTFSTEKGAKEIADAINGEVIDYDAYLQADLKVAA